MKMSTFLIVSRGVFTYFDSSPHYNSWLISKQSDLEIQRHSDGSLSIFIGNNEMNRASGVNFAKLFAAVALLFSGA